MRVYGPITPSTPGSPRSLLAYDVHDNGGRFVAAFVDRLAAEAYAEAVSRWTADGHPDSLHPDAPDGDGSITTRERLKREAKKEREEREENLRHMKAEAERISDGAFDITRLVEKLLDGEE